MNALSAGSPVCILLATFNGELYLDEQIRSITAQRHTHWRLLIRDDGSTDATVSIALEWARRDTRIRLIDDDAGSTGSAQQNFALLIRAGLETNADYFFFSDQDDVWHPEKLTCQIECLQANGHNPYLVHHDLEVVTNDNQTMHPSFFQLMRLNPKRVSINSLLSRNEITGCTIACNRHLLKRALPLPTHCIMHDWWLGLIASATGDVDVIEVPLIRYRQHSNNTIGAKSFWHGLNPLNNWWKGWIHGNQDFIATITQARALALHLRQRQNTAYNDNDCLPVIETYARLLEIPALERLKLCHQLEIFPNDNFLKLVNVLRLLSLPRKKNNGLP